MHAALMLAADNSEFESFGSPLQGGQGPQAQICRFIGPGGRAERDAFYRRLGRAGPGELPSALTTADVLLKGESGARTCAHACMHAHISLLSCRASAPEAVSACIAA